MSSIARALATLAALWTALPAGAAPDPALPVLEPLTDTGARPVLANGGFEEADAARAGHWPPYKEGYQGTAGAGREGSRGIACVNPDRRDGFGASQTVTLNQTDAVPIVVSGWSRAEGVDGAPDHDYSVYVDLQHTDGTPLWGQTARFHCGTHDWERREVVIVPEKPVRSMTVHALFRRHAGKVWFDDFTAAEIRAEGGAVVFDGRPMRVSAGPVADAAPSSRVATRDGLALEQQGPTIAAVRVGDRSLPARFEGGFMARDVAADSAVHRFDRGACPTLGLKLASAFQGREDHIAVEGEVSDTTGRDRAVTLYFVLPAGGDGWRWGDDIRRSRPIGGRGEFAHAVRVGCGATGTMSLFPLAAIHDERCGLGLGIDMGFPAQVRLFHHAGLGALVLACDFALVPDTGRSPSSARFRFVLFRSDPAWGFRAAWEKYMRIFPDAFAVRAREQGLWMPFTDVSTVEGWEDFGFKFHEGDNNVPFDDAHGILSFRYTEPMTWWMSMPKGTPRTEEAAVRLRDEMARGSNAHLRALAEATVHAGMFDENGRPGLQFHDTPWCDGVVWSLNPNPHLPQRPNGASVHWSDEIRERLYGEAAKGRRDGEYLDSLEGYVTSDFNYRREHFRFTTVPLTFDSDTKRPVLFKGLAVYEFTRWIAEDVHRMEKLMFANGVPYRFAFLCPWLDVLGTETDWLREGRYQPAGDETMSLWRTMSGRKPYLLLMNTDYDAFAPHVETYFQRALFYGMWPGFFSHNASDHPYWKSPRWYNRDRPLFKKYLPLVRRVAEAGWQPVTGAVCDNPRMRVERYGTEGAGGICLTVLNDDAAEQSGRLRLRAPLEGAAKNWTACELVSNKMIEADDDAWPLRLAPQQAVVLELRRR